ncbi:MAG TPA: hypothetical protein PLD17_16365, partial [Flavobacteriales bacterium]|nr:hypothetical protein [Flavobacteriales bacterium]
VNSKSPSFRSGLEPKIPYRDKGLTAFFRCNVRYFTVRRARMGGAARCHHNAREENSNQYQKHLFHRS